MVARNLYYNYYNKQKNLLSMETEDLEQSTSVALGVRSDTFVQNDILEEVLQKEERKKLWEAVNRPKGQKKEVIMLQYFGDFSIKEIAAMLKITLGNVKVISYRAKKELKEYLKRTEDL